MDKENLKRYIDNWNDERNTAMIYFALSEWEEDERLAEIYRRMGESEVRHSERWEEQIRIAGGKVPEFHPL
jgi:rubrerythrin